ncbi:hypothetical protein BD779DRAFT_205238 [Infundibulicybe gibba]|nr:hypothetical protein BD779DRAFT_205238 [Infundibulicybe gibba]
MMSHLLLVIWRLQNSMTSPPILRGARGCAFDILNYLFLQSFFLFTSFPAHHSVSKAITSKPQSIGHVTSGRWVASHVSGQCISNYVGSDYGVGATQRVFRCPPLAITPISIPEIRVLPIRIRKYRSSSWIRCGPSIPTASQFHNSSAKARWCNPSRVPRRMVRVSRHQRNKEQDTVGHKISNPSGTPPKAHRIGPAPGKGLGIFATRDLDMGDLIYVERPLLVLPSCANHVKIECPQNWSTEQVKRALMFEWDKHCHRAFERLDPGAQEAYLSLANIHADGGCGTTLGICRTNGFGMEELADTFIDVTMFEFEAPYTAVCKEFSRANHSCCPNATRYFDLQSFAFYFSATRPIKSGEEITITYSILEDVRSVRQKDNQKHKIVCDCPACGPDFEASDKNRLDIVASVDGLAANYVTWVVDRTLPKDEVIKTSRWWIKIIESEGLQCSPYYERHLDVIHRAYIALGDEENAIKYGILLGKWHKALGEFKPPIASFSDPRRLRKRSDWAIRKA